MSVCRLPNTGERISKETLARGLLRPVKLVGDSRTEEGRRNHSVESGPVSCDRCKRTNRPCRIPESRPLGRRRGALGRYRGLEKAYRKLQTEAKKANTSQNGLEERINLLPSSLADEEMGLESFLVDEPSEQPEMNTGDAPAMPKTPFLGPAMRITGASNQNEYQEHAEDHDQPSHEQMSNPLALLAYASDAAQAAEGTSSSVNNISSPESRRQSRPVGGESEGYRLLHRPGYVSLGLQLDRASLVQGLDSLLACVEAGHKPLDYFKRTGTRQRDIGPDLDPVELGLITMDEVNYLFPIYFTRLHPINGILDPILHTPDFVRNRSSLLFTWILTLTALFDHVSAPIAERLRLHGEKLSRYVHTCGLKSVEIVQGYYISLLSATPAKTLAEERSWLYTMYAIGVATDLGIDQEAGVTNISGTSNAQDEQDVQFSSPASTTNIGQSLGGPAADDVYKQRLLRNRERTWLRILLWDRANSAACGRIQSFPETNLTRAVETWWLHPLADMTDQYTSAFICLRRALASLQVEMKNGMRDSHPDPHWIRKLIDASLQPWCDIWLSRPEERVTNPSPEQVSRIFMHYVYKHGRLWTMSLALSDSISRAEDLDAIRQDCFEVAITCCETARAGTTPPHRFGIAALLGQHLMMILRARAVRLGEPASLQTQNYSIHHRSSEWQPAQPQIVQRSPLVSDWDPFLTPAISDRNDPGSDGFNDFFREIFGPGFEDLL
ncbi:hypothetical protein PENSTE_c001G01083 [Penicillium steckii]|uniref:Transcription factor domain-containing protein n=1 Tax=Penicillium steckii TaxID=303698 RepID=A0A1V6TYV2_9EURO|nr:hypothetical protein PENSTE_c001G01083 [Penicillium steckii]